MKKAAKEGIKLNLGCGYKQKKNYLNIDISPDCNPDKVWDLENKGLAFLPDNCAEEIYSSHFLEHIHPEKYHAFLKEMYRVSKHGALWILDLPFDNPMERTNPLHFRTYTYDSFYGFEPGSRNNYLGIWLKTRHRRTPKIIKAFFYTFPYIKKQVELKYEVVKPKELKG
ncbi:MAG: hypothetical protein HC945_04060 [Nitrosarchaeum sp.]|nr:hypothetical protein [Nitrosarchaeum sp.]